MAEPYYTLESLEAGKSFGFLIKRCGIVMTQIAERRFDSQPVSFTQWMVLMWLGQRPHASPSELSAHLGHDMGALTRVADELERSGMVRRDRSQHDRRAVELAITPDGRRQALAGKRLMVELLNELAEPYSNAEIDVLVSLLQRLLSRLQDTVQLSMPSEPQGAAPKQRGNRRSARAGPKSRNAHRQSQRKAPQ
jgi:DNA-binding MarR family transcriptional regulator